MEDEGQWTGVLEEEETAASTETNEDTNQLSAFLNPQNLAHFCFFNLQIIIAFGK